MIKKTLPLSTRLSLLFNGNSGLIALALMLFGSMFSYNTISTLDLQEIIHLRNNVEIGDGEIIAIFETNTSVDEVSIYGYDYVFHSPIGDLYWTSYMLGYEYDIGEKVKIEYNTIRPYVNRIQGMSNTLGGLIYLIPLLVAFLWMIYNFFTGIRKIQTIKNGELAKGKLIDKQATPISIHETTVYKLTFSFIAKDGESYETSIRTSKPEKLEDDRNKTLIYHKNNPNRALMLDGLPWSTGKVIKQRWC